MRHISKSIVSLVIVALVLASSPVFAQPSEPTQTEDPSPQTSTDTTQVAVDINEMTDPEQRMTYYAQQALTAFNDQKFEEAALLFEKAFDEKPIGRLLKNAVVAWYRIENCEEAARVAARLVSFLGEGDSNIRRQQLKDGEADNILNVNELNKVINCALDRTEELLNKDKIEEAKVLLTTASASAPSVTQRKKIDAYWKIVNDKLAAQEAASSQEDPLESQNGPGGFYKAAPWLGVTMMAAGGASLAVGVMFLTGENQKIIPGRALAGAGAVSIFLGAFSFIYWLNTSPNPEPSAGFNLYTNPLYASEGGLQRIDFFPSVSTSEVNASVGIRF